jgi:hypothetical protein
MSALEIQRTRASAIAGGLVSRSPQGAIACIFAGGSLGRGEVWCAQIDGANEVYSDVDLYVVVDDEAQLAAVRSVAASLTPPETSGVRFLRPPDIGVYTRSDLAAQPVRPGTVDLAVHHLLLHGDAAVPKRIRAPAPSRMARDESLYLLENRVTEIAATNPGAQGSDERLTVILALKARLDVHAAHAIAEGTFTPTLAARARAFASAPPRGLDAFARDDIAAAYHSAADPGGWLPGKRGREERERALRALSHAWRALAGDVLGLRNGISIDEAVSARCRRGAHIENARELVRLRHRTGLSSWRAVVAAARLSQRSPGAALRMDSLVRELHARGALDAQSFATHASYVDSLTRAFGYTNGPPEVRARAMHRVIS